MLLSERDARQRRCQESFGPLYVTHDGGQLHMPIHMAAAAPQYGSAYFAAVSQSHPFPTVASPSHCIGSQCMAWRWRKVGEQSVTDQFAAPVGYCGKAGVA